MTLLDRSIDHAAARLTHAEPRPDVRARVLASIAADPRRGYAPMRWPLTAVAAGVAALLLAAVAIPRWQDAAFSRALAATAIAPAPVGGASVTAIAHGRPDLFAASLSIATKTPATKRAAAPPAPEYVTPTPLPVLAVEAIDAPVEIQPTPLSIPQLSRKPIAPGAVHTTVPDENGSSGRR